MLFVFVFQVVRLLILLHVDEDAAVPVVFISCGRGSGLILLVLGFSHLAYFIICFVLGCSSFLCVMFLSVCVCVCVVFCVCGFFLFYVSGKSM